MSNSKSKILIFVSAALLCCCWLLYRNHSAPVNHIYVNSVKLLEREPVDNSVVNGGLPNGKVVYPVATYNEEPMALYDVRLTRTEATCEKMENIGQGEGQMTICMTTNYLPKSPCLVYSFGIADDFSFDRDMVSKFGCEVFAFDPSNGKPNHTVTKDLHFYSIGVAASNDDDYPAPNSNGKTTWKLRTLKTLVHAMKHQDRIIDILKIDIEEWVYDALEEALSTGILNSVKQIVVEFHIKGDMKHTPYVNYLMTIMDLYKAGFRIVFTSMKKCMPYCHYGDVTFVNKNFDKKLKD